MGLTEDDKQVFRVRETFILGSQKVLWCNRFTSNRHVFDGKAKAECQICPVGSRFGAKFPGSQVPAGSLNRSRFGGAFRSTLRQPPTTF